MSLHAIFGETRGMQRPDTPRVCFPEPTALRPFLLQVASNLASGGGRGEGGHIASARAWGVAPGSPSRSPSGGCAGPASPRPVGRGSAGKQIRAENPRSKLNLHPHSLALLRFVIPVGSPRVGDVGSSPGDAPVPGEAGTGVVGSAAGMRDVGSAAGCRFGCGDAACAGGRAGI